MWDTGRVPSVPSLVNARTSATKGVLNVIQTYSQSLVKSVHLIAFQSGKTTGSVETHLRGCKNVRSNSDAKNCPKQGY